MTCQVNIIYQLLHELRHQRQLGLLPLALAMGGLRLQPHHALSNEGGLSN